MDPINWPLVETEWLAEQLLVEYDKPGLPLQMQIVDARWRGDGTSSRKLFEAGHIPGAVHLDWDLDLGWTNQSGVRYMLLPPEPFARKMEASGIGNDTLVVTYADTNYSGAARLWWALRYYGHEKVMVLNGGITKWIVEGRPLHAGPALLKFLATPPQFLTRLQPSFLAEASEINAALSAKNRRVQIIDTRPPEQFRGEAVWTPAGSLYLAAGVESIEVGARGSMRAGHIPGAINLPAGRFNLNHSDWTYQPANTIRDKALALGLKPEQPVITYCGSGISASLSLLGLYLAGYRHLSLYDASWEEWGTDPNFPVE